MTSPRWFSPALSYPLALLLGGGCLSPRHDLGDTPEQRTADPVPPAVVEAPPPLAELASEFEGLWLGEAEDPLALADGAVYRFPSGSTRILLDWRPTGGSTITFGDGPPLPPPTDPEVGYPPNAESYVIAASPLHPWEGYAYPLWGAPFHSRDLFAIDPKDFFDPDNGEFDRDRRLGLEGRVIDGLLLVQYDVEDLFRPWCALQPPDSYCAAEALLEGGASLALNYEEDFCIDPQTDERMDCGKAYLCYSHCPALDSDTRVRPQLEVRFSADGLVGVFSQGAVFLNERGFLTPLGAVHFRKVDERAEE